VSERSAPRLALSRPAPHFVSPGHPGHRSGGDAPPPSATNHPIHFYSCSWVTKAHSPAISHRDDVCLLFSLTYRPSAPIYGRLRQCASIADETVLDLCGVIATMSQELLWDVTHGGPLCVSDANWHYLWGLKDALAVVTGIERVACTTPSALLCCWRHETLRVFGDRLTCTADVAALTASVNEILRRNTAVIAGASVLVGVDALEDYLLSVCCMSLSDFFRTLDPANEGQVSRNVLASALGRLPAAAGNEAEGSGGGGNAFAGVEGVRNTGRLLGSLPDVFGLADLKALRQHPAWADPTASSPGDTEAPLGRRDMPPFYVDFIDPAADDHLAATTRAGAQGTSGHCKGECKPCWRLSDLHEQVLLHAQALTPSVWAGGARPQCVVTHEFLRHLVRALRVLNIPGAHAILVAEPGAGAREVASLAAHIAHCELHIVAAGSEQAFNGELRALFRVAGCQNARVAAIMDGHALSHGVLERLNGLLVTGQVFDLFGRDERAALL